MEHIYEVVCPELSLRERPSLAAKVVATVPQHTRVACVVGEVKNAYGYLWRQVVTGEWVQVGVVDYKGDVVQNLAVWVDVCV